MDALELLGRDLPHRRVSRQRRVVDHHVDATVLACGVDDGFDVVRVTHVSLEVDAGATDLLNEVVGWRLRVDILWL